jgi:dTMP kinase
MATSPGRLIALEGIDGCGKSTQARLLADRIGALYTFEPGATALGASLRTLLLEPGPAVHERTEALLMAADRAQHVAEVVRPALGRGRWVVTDRFSASTLAYQGYGRSLDIGELAQLVEWATGGLTPDLAILVEVDPALGLARRRGSVDDRMADGYRRVVERQETPWLVVDGGGTIDQVAAEIWAGVQSRFGDRR